MGYEATGKLHQIGDIEQKSERFRKREFVLELNDNPKYPQLVQFQLTGDRCDQLDGMNEGDAVRLEFSLRGRKWEGGKGVKYFNSLDVWKVEAVGRRQMSSTQNTTETAQTDAFGGSPGGGEDDPIPF